MNKPIYTIGYAKRSLDDLRRIVGDGILVDVRMRPNSRKADFNQQRLIDTFGDSYQWIQELGNKQFKDPHAGTWYELNKPMRGLLKLWRLRRSTDRPIFLMCVCANPNWCHRTDIAEKARSLLGYTVTEWTE